MQGLQRWGRGCCCRLAQPQPGRRPRGSTPALSAGVWLARNAALAFDFRRCSGTVHEAARCFCRPSTGVSQSRRPGLQGPAASPGWLRRRCQSSKQRESGPPRSGGTGAVSIGSPSPPRAGNQGLNRVTPEGGEGGRNSSWSRSSERLQTAWDDGWAQQVRPPARVQSRAIRGGPTLRLRQAFDRPNSIMPWQSRRPSGIPEFVEADSLRWVCRCDRRGCGARVSLISGR